MPPVCDGFRSHGRAIAPVLFFRSIVGGATRQFAERQSINAPLQGSAADIIRRAMIRMPSAIARSGLQARMLLQVHDELVFEAPEAEAEATATLVREVMTRAAEPAVHISVPLVVETGVGKHWGEAH